MNNPRFWEQLYDQIPHMKQLYFAGGESTIIDEHYDLLEEVVRRGYADKIELRYNSNAVELPDRLFDLWSKFRQVKFHFSVDSLGEKNDYIRYPTNWDHLVDHMHKLDQTPDNVIVTTACTVMALNIMYVPDFIKWKMGQDFRKFNAWPNGAGMINWHFAYWPPQLNVKVLPSEAKAEVCRRFDDFYLWLDHHWQDATGVRAAGVSKEQFMNAGYGIKRLKSMVNFMGKEDWSQRLPELLQWVSLIDRTRNLNFASTFPELAVYLRTDEVI